jgi:hypothetical protein
MKLWQAMLEGAKAGPQLFNEQGDYKGGTCAIGALYLGLSVGKSAVLDYLHNFFEVIAQLNQYTQCPVGPCNSYTAGRSLIPHAPTTIGEVIIHLNNDHRWSRQRIADWLAQIEMTYTEKTPLVGIKVRL